MLTPEKLSELYPKLAEPFLDKAIEKSKASETKKGYNTTGYGCQYLINRMNEVLGPAYWRAREEIVAKNIGTSSTGKPVYDITMKMTVQIGNPACKVSEDGTIQYFEVIAEQTCYGGHVSYGTLADALKGAYTNSLKKTLALFGVGRQAYEGSIDDDSLQQNGQNNQYKGYNQGGQRPNQGQQPQGGRQNPQGGQRSNQGQQPHGGQRSNQGQQQQGNRQTPQGGQQSNQGGQQNPQGGQPPNRGGQQSPPPQGGQQTPQGGQRPNQGQQPQGGQQASQSSQQPYKFVPFEKAQFKLTQPVKVGNGPNGTRVATLVAVDQDGQVFELRPDNKVFSQLDYFTAMQQGQTLTIDGQWDLNARKVTITAVAAN